MTRNKPFEYAKHTSDAEIIGKEHMVNDQLVPLSTQADGPSKARTQKPGSRCEDQLEETTMGTVTTEHCASDRRPYLEGPAGMEAHSTDKALLQLLDQREGVRASLKVCEEARRRLKERMAEEAATK